MIAKESCMVLFVIPSHLLFLFDAGEAGRTWQAFQCQLLLLVAVMIMVSRGGMDAGERGRMGMGMVERALIVDHYHPVEIV